VDVHRFLSCLAALLLMPASIGFNPATDDESKKPTTFIVGFSGYCEFSKLDLFLRLRIPGMTHSQGPTHATSAHAATRLDAVSFQKHKSQR